ncbi:hypothetical protein [Bacillus suaedaesalsae]|uniref:Uncharacterized protein n=1 Tax=Bacillus suaedaesalsae TaxID=2810349 RepID=A0ABS2DKX4_9BACI|nr:hypothetical protein [Bacillus suaedaesalsae]MBM6619147.1 hypothetical protein [Bacillus suaedaesalsae]
MFSTYFFGNFVTILIVAITIKLINRFGLSVGNVKHHFGWMTFVALTLMGLFLRLSAYFSDLQYPYKHHAEGGVFVVILYILLSLMSRNEYLLKNRFNDITNTLLMAGGVVTILLILNK